MFGHKFGVLQYSGEAVVTWAKICEYLCVVKGGDTVVWMCVLRLFRGTLTRSLKFVSCQLEVPD